ncbi:hypothetical protein B9Z55_003170 [Caenorhabditis nigoni]|uniref:Sulfotransferase domain-containing protein n=1 Tax=Caenorhabditis nigoni TaxID=1611254 RepID=A0A2G5VPI8_9PELO|nr:hypothetical protein B9Z55_003170 [Caenorhabditis nigoni]
MASAIQTYFWNKNSEYMRMDTVGTGRDYKKYCCIFLTISACLGIYGYFYYENEYTIYVDGKIVNFTGVEDFIPPFVSYYHEFLEESQFHNPSQQLLNDPDTVRFAFIRDPIQRFVSLYLDKCIHTDFCFNCNKDMRCFVQNIYETLKNISDYRHGYRDLDMMAEHAAPLSWMCNFDKELEKWHLLMMGSDFEERKSSILHLANILKRQGFNETLVDKIQKDTMAGETAHSTHTSSHRQEAERQIREDPYIRDLLHKIYFFDYVVFPFKRDVLDEKYQTNFWKVPEE